MLSLFKDSTQEEPYPTQEEPHTTQEESHTTQDESLISQLQKLVDNFKDMYQKINSPYNEESIKKYLDRFISDINNITNPVLEDND